MKSRILISAVFLLLGSCQKSEIKLVETSGFSLEEVSALPGVLTESSGIEMSSETHFWSFNDRNGKAELYGFMTSGVLKFTLKITNATNTDWEGIARGELGNLYIGDFGNNDNDRRSTAKWKGLFFRTVAPCF